MSALETKIGLDVLKPAASLIEAAFGPKIDNLKKWAKEADLRGKLNAEDLSKFFSRYFVRLYRYTSEVKTIVLPNTKLNINDIYEPLLVTFPHQNNSAFTFNINLIKYGENLLLIDRAGMGKTTFVKYMINELLNRGR